MLIWKIIAGILLVLFLLSLLRVGILVRYQSALTVEARIGVIKKSLYPKAEKKPAKEPTAPEATEGTAATKKKRLSLKALTKEEWRSLIDTVLPALKRTARKTCRRLRIDPLKLCVIFGGSDPANTAINYGRANAVLWNLMPRLEELFNIPNPAIHLGMDYTAEKTLSAEGEVSLTLRICDLLVILLTLAIPLYKWYRRVKKAHQTAPAAETLQTQTTEDKTSTV